MPAPLLLSKLFIPPPRAEIVARPRLIERLNEGLRRRLVLVSAPAGFGKTTLVSEWVASIDHPAAWLSLDERDSDPARFTAYLVAALQTIQPGIGEALQPALQSPQSLQLENILTMLANEIALIREDFLLVLDDYQLIDSQAVDRALEFLLEHQPPAMHLLIATREDPSLPLSRLRARGQLSELRLADLRFTPGEAAEFLNRMMQLELSEQDVAALEERTEGWIAGLQMAALSMKGLDDQQGFIQSFTGSNRFVMDYLLEEVLSRQPEHMQSFLQVTSILDRMCGALCDAVLGDPSAPGQTVLEQLERSNLFIVPQDNERKWYRYHHLFASLLQRRLGQSLSAGQIAGLHVRASEWYERNDMTLEAFRHAAAAEDLPRARRLMESPHMPLYLRGAVTTILDWLVRLPVSVLDAQPELWWKQAELLVQCGQPAAAEEKLQKAEAALGAAAQPGAVLDEATRAMIGKIAAIRSNLGVAMQNAETILFQAQRALEYLPEEDHSMRTSVTRDMGFAHLYQGKRAEAGRLFAKAETIAKLSGNIVEPMLAHFGRAMVYEQQTQLRLAEERYQEILPAMAEYSILNVGVVYLELARIRYEWNDLKAAEMYAGQSLSLARQFNHLVYRLILCEVLLTRLQLVRGDVTGAASRVSQVVQIARQHNFLKLPGLGEAQVLSALRQGELQQAEELARAYDLPRCRARVLLKQGQPGEALRVLGSYRRQMEENGWQDERLRAIVLQAVAFHLNHEPKMALEALCEALRIAEPDGFVRLFLDEGEPMRELLSAAAGQGRQSGYAGKLLSAFAAEAGQGQPSAAGSPLLEPLSPRELEILRLLARGLSNRQICERLVLALDTVKGHNRKIFDKLDVKSRSEAVARAHELDLL